MKFNQIFRKQQTTAIIYNLEAGTFRDSDVMDAVILKVLCTHLIFQGNLNRTD
jgi:hypothetical protein